MLVERVKSWRQHQGNQTVTAAELLLAIGVEGDVVDNYGLLASNPVEDTATAWFNMLQPNVSLAEFTKVTKAAFNDEVEPCWIEVLPGVIEKLGLFKQQGMILGIATADTKDLNHLHTPSEQSGFERDVRLCRLFRWRYRTRQRPHYSMHSVKMRALEP
ncbi:hypothetical protein OK016_29955 [Vibrio chagasii]|nr:hypothetical protein [Vibrio chagasii]